MTLNSSDWISSMNNETFSFTIPSTALSVEDIIFNGKLSNVSIRTIPNVKRVVYNNPATIIFWSDGTKTVVKCMDGEPFEKYAGFCAALAKKVFGSTSKAKKVAGAKKKDEVEE